MAVPAGLDDLSALELLVSTVELGSLSQAAGRHHLSQPAVSMRISRLERRLGLDVVRRSPTGITPTEKGEAVVEWARELLTQADRIGAAVDALRTTVDSQATVAASLTIAEHLVPEWLSAARTRDPGGRISVTVANSGEVIELVRDGSVTLGFIENDDRLNGLRSRVVGHDLLVVVVAPDHPWTGRRTPLRPHHLASTPMVLREPGSGTRSTYEHALARAGERPVAPAVELSSTAAIRSAVSAGLGPTVISQLSVEGDLRAGRLVTVATTGVDLRRSLRAVWRGGTPPLLATLMPER